MIRFYDDVYLCDGEISLSLLQTLDGDEKNGIVPTYIFDIIAPDCKTAGRVSLRIGDNEKTYYGGHIGYAVEPEYRGSRYAAKACRLLFMLARRHGMSELIITCNPDNIASARTIEAVGGVFETEADLPEHNELYIRGERRKRIYRVILGK